MKIKVSVFLLILIIGIAGSAAAVPHRLGLAAGIPNVAVNYRMGRVDFKLAYDFSSETSREFIFLSGDYRLVNHRPLAPPLHVSVGLGGYGKVILDDPEINNDSFKLEYGLRMPVALSLLFFNNFIELFVEISPGIEFVDKPAFSEEPVQVWVGFTFELD